MQYGQRSPSELVSANCHSNNTDWNKADLFFDYEVQCSATQIAKRPIAWQQLSAFRRGEDNSQLRVKVRIRIRQKGDWSDSAWLLVPGGLTEYFTTDITTIAWVFRRMFHIKSNGLLKTKVEHLVPPIYLLVARTDKVSLKRRSGSSGSVLQKGLQKKSWDSVARSDETKCTNYIFRASTEIINQ